MSASSPFQKRTPLNRFLQTLAFSAIALAFSATPVQAAKRQVVTVEKQSSVTAKRRISRTFIVAKRRAAVRMESGSTPRPHQAALVLALDY